MKTIRVISEREYDVKIDCNWRSELGKLAIGRARVGVVVAASLADRVGDLSLEDVDLHIFEISDGEEAKSADNLQLLWQWLGAGGFTRSDLLVAIGGGATTDISGFAAATWLRGIDWIAIPTTVAGMVDAAVGGKTGMNSSFGKNLIGAFHSPIAVLTDLSWLTTLSDRDFSAGLAEVVKCGFISDETILETIESRSLSELRSSSTVMSELIYKAVSVKASAVSSDFKESFTREILNYGHTLAHAIEIDSDFTLRHGEAVSIGMVFAAELAGEKGVLHADLIQRHREILIHLNLPISYPASSWSRLLPLLALDKKSRGRQSRFVAISHIGKTLRLEDCSLAQMSSAYERISS